MTKQARKNLFNQSNKQTLTGRQTDRNRIPDKHIVHESRDGNATGEARRFDAVFCVLFFADAQLQPSTQTLVRCRGKTCWKHSKRKRRPRRNLVFCHRIHSRVFGFQSSFLVFSIKLSREPVTRLEGTLRKPSFNGRRFGHRPGRKRVCRRQHSPDSRGSDFASCSWTESSAAGSSGHDGVALLSCICFCDKVTFYSHWNNYKNISQHLLQISYEKKTVC